MVTDEQTKSRPAMWQKCEVVLKPLRRSLCNAYLQRWSQAVQGKSTENDLTEKQSCKVSIDSKSTWSNYKKGKLRKCVEFIFVQIIVMQNFIEKFGNRCYRVSTHHFPSTLSWSVECVAGKLCVLVLQASLGSDPAGARTHSLLIGKLDALPGFCNFCIVLST